MKSQDVEAEEETFDDNMEVNYSQLSQSQNEVNETNDKRDDLNDSVVSADEKMETD